MLNQENNEKIIEALEKFISSVDYHIDVDDILALASARKRDLEERVYYWAYELECRPEYDGQFDSRNDAYNAAQDALMSRECNNMEDVSEYYTFREEVTFRNYCIGEGDPELIFEDSETISFDKRDFGY